MKADRVVLSSPEVHWESFHAAETFMFRFPAFLYVPSTPI
jgi:hypothetical protein